MFIQQKPFSVNENIIKIRIPSDTIDSNFHLFVIGVASSHKLWREKSSILVLDSELIIDGGRVIQCKSLYIATNSLTEYGASKLEQIYDKLARKRKCVILFERNDYYNIFDYRV